MLDQGTLRTLSTNRSELIAGAERGSVDLDQLSALADLEATAAFDLEPQPLDVVEHLRTNYAATRELLGKLAGRDPIEIARISSEDGYVYGFRPRTPFRRVLDHALDHHLQINQWLEWRETGRRPIPADGWASSAVTLDEDLTPLSQADLDAWLWRIDTAMSLLIERAARLTPDELDWTPDDGGWSLRTALHHVARDRFYATWLEVRLPTEPLARFRAASSWCRDRIIQAIAAHLPQGHALFNREVKTVGFDDIVGTVLASESRLLHGLTIEGYVRANQ